VGPAARRDEILKQILIVTTTFGEWKKENPDSLTLSRDTGYRRDYDSYPYGTYEENDVLLFGVKNLDKELPPKEVVYGVEVGDISKAYPKSVLDVDKIIEDRVGDVSLRIERLDSGESRVTNLSDGATITPIRLFWFAWAAFHPDTELYQLPQ